MPIDYSKYPDNWLTEIRPDILERDCHKCAFCGLQNYVWIFRDKDGNHYLAEMVHDAHESNGYSYFDHELQNCADRERPQFKVVLTIAHLDHDITNNDYENLKALCQQCHLRYDAPMKALKRQKQKAELQPELF